MKKHKVLMLGWEYPPFINGGLGVACHGLCDALSKIADLKLVLPKTPDIKECKFETIGLNHISEELLEKTEYETLLKEVEEIDKIDVPLDPYLHTEKKTPFAKRRKKIKKATLKKIRKYLGEKFTFENLYGEDIIQNVILYADLVQQLSDALDFDIIHAHDWMTYLAGMKVKEKTGKPLVLHVHSLDYDRAGRESRSWIYEVERNALHEADLIMPVSNYTGSILTSHYGISKSKILTVYNGAEEIAPYKNEKSFPEKMVLFIGRLTGQKGPEYFLDIATKIYREYKDVRFVIAGTGERLFHLLEDGAYRQIGNRVHFTGFLDKQKIRDLLAIADVYCMPSVSEPFGLTAVEAAQFEVPIVISERSGVAEVLSGSLKADFWDIDLMVKHIVDLLTDEKKREEVISKNTEDLKNLTWENAAKKVVLAYNQLLETHRQPKKSIAYV